jgi:hypothetical protein
MHGVFQFCFVLESAKEKKVETSATADKKGKVKMNGGATA